MRILIAFLVILALASTGHASRTFNGTSGLITVPAATQINNLGPFTVVFWARRVTAGEAGLGRIFDKNLSVFTLFTRSDGMELLVTFSGTDLRRVSDSNWWLPVAWRHIAVTWDGSTTAANAHMYVDGAEVGHYSVTQNATGSRDSDAAGALIIGNRSDDVRTYDGSISHMQFYNRVLSLSEINMLKYQPRNLLSGCVSYLPLYGMSPEPDLSGNVDNGTLTGTAVGGDPPIGAPYQ